MFLSDHRKVKMFVHIVRNASFLWPKASRQLTSPAGFCGTRRQSSLKPIDRDCRTKIGTNGIPTQELLLVLVYKYCCGLKLCAFQCASFFGWHSTFLWQWLLTTVLSSYIFPLAYHMWNVRFPVRKPQTLIAGKRMSCVLRHIVLQCPVPQ